MRNKTLRHMVSMLLAALMMINTAASGTTFASEIPMEDISDLAIEDNSESDDSDEIIDEIHELEANLFGAAIRLTSAGSFEPGSILDVTELRPLADITRDEENGIQTRDRYSVEDAQYLISDELGLTSEEVFTIDAAFDIRVIDQEDYDLVTPEQIHVEIEFPKKTGNPSDNDLLSLNVEDLKTSALYHLKDDGTWEKISFNIDQNANKVVFDTGSFSPFVFGRVEAAPIEEAEEEYFPEEEYVEEVTDASGSEETEGSAYEENEDIQEPETVGEDSAAASETEGQEESPESQNDAENIDESQADGTNGDEKSNEENMEESVETKTEDTDGNDESHIEGTEDSAVSQTDGNENADKSEEDEVEESVREEGEVEADVKEASVRDTLAVVDPSTEEPLLNNSQLTAATRRLLGSNSLLGAPATQAPVTVDDVTIERITLNWVTASTNESEPAGTDQLVLIPQNDDVPTHQWQIDFSLSTKNDFEAGDIEVVIPAYIWLDRNNEETGSLTLAVPEEPDTGADFAWKRVDDKIVFTNTRKLPGATKVLLQGSYRNIKAHNLVDVDVAATSDYKDAQVKGISRDLQAVINVSTENDETATMTSNTINARMDTSADISSANKTAYNTTSKEYYVYWDVPSNLPDELKPENPQDYVYVRWYVSGLASGNQPYIMTVSDHAIDEYGCRVLGVQGDVNQENIPSDDNGKSVEAVMFKGYAATLKSAYVWTAYEKSAFPESGQTYTLTNTATVTVTGQDDLIDKELSVSGSVGVAIPETYTIRKEWEDDNNAAGLRPSSQSVRIYRDGVYWKSVSLREENDWTYSWSDEGKGYSYSPTEQSFASGTTDIWYDADGKIHSTRWSYRMKERTYDPESRTWTFKNQIVFDGIVSNMAGLSKRANSPYNDYKQRSTRDRALNELLQGKDVIVPYYVSGTSTDWDVWYDNTGSSNKTHFVNIILEDSLGGGAGEEPRNPFFINGQEAVPVTDYEIAYADIDKPVAYDYSVIEGDSENPRYSLERLSDGSVDAVYEAYINGSWIKVGECVDGAFSPFNGATISGHRLMLPANTVRFREIARSGAAATTLSYLVGVRIHPSEAVLAAINAASEQSDYLMLTADNNARIFKMDEGNNGSNVSEDMPLGVQEDWELSEMARAYLHGRLFRVAATQSKNFRVTENDQSGRRLTVHTTANVTLQSNVINSADYQRAVANGDIPYVTGGVWYDLLPKGVEPDVSTVKLQQGDYLKDVRTIPNYKGSGRTLLIVKAELGKHVSYTNSNYESNGFPKEGYKQDLKIEFDSYYSWDEVKNYGLTNIKNSIAFQADEKEVGNIAGWRGEPDDPAGNQNMYSASAVGSDSDIMTDLSPRDDPSFLYAGAIMESDVVDISAVTSIRKYVSVDGTGIWSNGQNGEATVYEGGKYTYKITLGCSSDTPTKDIIILDSLESYIPTDQTEDYGDNQWKGKFESLDISALNELGVKPVVYYCTRNDFNIAEMNTTGDAGVVPLALNNSENWSTTLPEDPSQVTAFAIDCRKTTDNTDFKLGKNDLITVYVHMRAPAGAEAENIWKNGNGSKANDDPAARDETDPDDNSHAYNNVYLDATQEGTHEFIHQDYVKVGIVPYNLKVTKVWEDEDDNDRVRPESISVRLVKDGGETVKTISLDGNSGWKGVFEHITRYDEHGNWINYTIEEFVPDGYTMHFDVRGDQATLTNIHEPETIDISCRKIWVDDNASVRPESITLRLLENGVFSGKTATVRANSTGEWEGEFTDLYKYKNGVEVAYTVEEIVPDDYISSYDFDEGTWVITNTYYPYGDLRISKEIVNATSAAEETEFSFAVELHDPDGNELVDEYSYETTDGRVGSIKNGGSLTLKGGQAATIKDIPSHSSYKITEMEEKGFSITSNAGSTGTILSGKENYAAFVNTYQSRGSFLPRAKKILNGRQLANYQFRFDLYELNIETHESELIRRAANTADGSVIFGSIGYDESDDGKAFYYVINEQEGYESSSTSSAGLQGDVYREGVIKVIPMDNGDGTMTCTPVYLEPGSLELEEAEITSVPLYEMDNGITLYKDWYDGLTQSEKDGLLDHYADENGNTPTLRETEGFPVTFINDYFASGDIVLRAWKKLDGRALNSGEFEFELLDSNMNLIESAVNNTDGSIVFDPKASSASERLKQALSFNEMDSGKTFYFYIREKAGSDTTLDYCDSVFCYAVTVVDDGSGSLQFKQGYRKVIITGTEDSLVYSPGEETTEIPLFINTLKPGELTLEKKTEWEEGQEPDPDKKFHFRITLINPDGTSFEGEDGKIEYDIEQVENNGEEQNAP